MNDSSTRFPGAKTPAIREFLIAAEAFRAKATPPLSASSLSSIIFADGKLIGRLQAGAADVTTTRLADAWTSLRALEAGGPRTRKTSPTPKEKTHGQ